MGAERQVEEKTAVIRFPEKVYAAATTLVDVYMDDRTGWVSADAIVLDLMGVRLHDVLMRLPHSTGVYRSPIAEALKRLVDVGVLERQGGNYRRRA